MDFEYIIGTHYMDARRATIAKYFADRPILRRCEEGVTKRGSTPCTWWWEQPMQLEADADGPGALELGGV